MDNITTIAQQLDSDPITLVASLFFGTIPAFLWLKFWLREDKERPEPTGLLFLTFLAGMLSVLIVLPIQKFINNVFYDNATLIILWVATEEVLKLLAVLVIATRSSYADEPIDFPIYFITGALGFAALENALFLAYPIGLNDATVSILTGNLRFLGATLLHAVASGMIGLMLGLSFYKSRRIKVVAIFFGLILAVVLHSAFNFFIIESSGEEVLKIFSFLWIVTIISMLVFEKLRRMSENLYLKDVKIHGPVNELLIRR